MSKRTTRAPRGDALRLAAGMLILFLGSGASADRTPPIEHELIPADLADDVSLGVRLDGDLPAAIQTPSGLVSAPDPREPVPPGAPAPPTSELAGHKQGDDPTSRFTPDTDTRRPDTLRYDDPFTPRTAPFKRFVAFDDVDASYALTVHDPHRKPILQHEAPRDAEDQFYGDIVLDLAAKQPTRIPTVGPGARVLHARLGAGAEDIGFALLHDGADNWFVETPRSGRARLVIELSIPRAAFGGPFHDEIDPRPASALPHPVQADADIVARHIGVPKASRHETIEALVDYFRGFTESDAPLTRTAGRSVYLDLALARTGVCRHRAYAFVITALGLGVRARMVLNEAHAWVEVTDGLQWKRIDLGGAGVLLEQEPPDSKSVTYRPPPDPFSWPAGAARGEDLARTAGGATPSSTPSGTHNPARPSSSASAPGSGVGAADPPAELQLDSTVTVMTAEARALRGQLVHTHGAVTSHDAPCPNARVAISLSDSKTGESTALGELATDHEGTYSGAFSLPGGLTLGDYEVVATALGDGRCAASVSR